MSLSHVAKNVDGHVYKYAEMRDKFLSTFLSITFIVVQSDPVYYSIWPECQCAAELYHLLRFLVFSMFYHCTSPSLDNLCLVQQVLLADIINFHYLSVILQSVQGF